MVMTALIRSRPPGSSATRSISPSTASARRRSLRAAIPSSTNRFTTSLASSRALDLVDPNHRPCQTEFSGTAGRMMWPEMAIHQRKHQNPIGFHRAPVVSGGLPHGLCAQSFRYVAINMRAPSHCAGVMSSVVEGRSPIWPGLVRICMRRFGLATRTAEVCVGWIRCCIPASGTHLTARGRTPSAATHAVGDGTARDCTPSERTFEIAVDSLQTVTFQRIQKTTVDHVVYCQEQSDEPASNKACRRSRCREQCADVIHSWNCVQDNSIYPRQSKQRDHSQDNRRHLYRCQRQFRGRCAQGAPNCEF